MTGGNDRSDEQRELRSSSTVTIVQTTLPDYRTPFFTELSLELGSRLTLLSGEQDWYPDVRHVHAVPHTRVLNVFLARRRLLWQKRTLGPLFAADVAVFDLNPRILSAWLAMIIRRLARRRSLLWGHAWPRRGDASWTDRIRSTMRRLAGEVIVYTETEADELRRRSPGLVVTAASNALYARDELRPASGDAPPTTLLYVGRLSASKRVDVVVDAFRIAETELPDDVRLVVVGDGAERPSLESRAAGSTRVEFAGHVSSVDQLRALYGNAIASVSAGEVGLSLVQSLGFGVPMIVAGDEDHGPEIEAARAGDNSVFFAPTTAYELASTLIATVRDRDHWLARRNTIADWTRTRYSIERMVESFLEALEPVAGSRTGAHHARRAAHGPRERSIR